MVLAAWNTVSASIARRRPLARSRTAMPTCAPGTSAMRATSRARTAVSAALDWASRLVVVSENSANTTVRHARNEFVIDISRAEEVTWAMGRSGRLCVLSTSAYGAIATHTAAPRSHIIAFKHSAGVRTTATRSARSRTSRSSVTSVACAWRAVATYTASAPRSAHVAATSAASAAS